MQVSCSLEVKSCALCGQDHATAAPFNRCTEHGIAWRYHICRNCGLVYQSPQMNDEETSRYYAGDYWQLWDEETVPSVGLTALQQGRAEHLLSLLPPGLAVRRILDVGCAAGFLLRESRRQLDAAVVGIEPDGPSRQAANDQGFTVYASLDELVAAGEPRFDCITMSHVLEHFRDPVAILRRLREELLAPGGHLVVEVPNLYAHKSFEPSHPVCFNETTLRAALTAAGFAVRRLLLHNHPRSDVEGPLNISALAVPAESPASPDFAAPNIWLERVKRAYLSKRGEWWRRAWKSFRVGLLSLFVSDLEY